MNFFQRLKWAASAFARHDPIIILDNGMKLDLENRKLIIPSDFHLHTEGDLRLSSDKHVILHSGRTPESREGYVHGVWVNPDIDEYGRPLLDDSEDDHGH